MSPKSKTELAGEHLERALSDLDVDPVKAVHWLFVALEAAIDALAAQHGIETGPSHLKRRQAAEALAQANVLEDGITDLLQRLDEARKALEYDGEDFDMEDGELEEVVREVEGVVELAQSGEKQGDDS